jgi:O-antigen/teichoic acid export membrane protein
MLAARRVRRLMFPELPGTVRQFVAGAAGLMVANACAAALATGIPFLVQLTARGELPDSAGVVFAALIATRTPLLLPINGYQLLLIRYLTTHRQHLVAALPKLAILAVSATAVAVAAAYVAGPAVLRLVFGSDFEIAHRTMAGLACGGAALAALTFTGAMTIAASRQLLCAAGWVAATLVTASVLAFDAPFEARIVAAVIVGPVCGCAVHLVGARSYYRRSTT